MASIGKISFKAVKIGTEGFSASIYFENKRIGKFANENLQSHLTLDKMNDEFMEEVNKYIKRTDIRKHLLEANEIGLLSYLMELAEKESIMKKGFAKGLKAVIVAYSKAVNQDGLLDTNSEIQESLVWNSPTTDLAKVEPNLREELLGEFSQETINNLEFKIYFKYSHFQIA